MTTMQGMKQNTPVTGPSGYPQGQPVAVQPYLWNGLAEKFLKGEPKILGVVQVLIALMIFSFGMVILVVSVSYNGNSTFSVYTGYTIWGSIMFIISGALSIGSGKRTTKGLVRGSLGVNITSAVFAAVGIILNAISLHIYSFHPYHCHGSKMYDDCLMATSILMGLECLVFILSVLEFCIALSLSAFGCKVMCCNPSGIVLIMPPSPYVAETAPSGP